MTMKQFNISAVAVAIGLTFSAGAMAQSMTKDEYKAGKDGIAAQYKSAKANCNSFAGNVKDICRVEAMGNEKIAKADLGFRYKPSDNTRYEARVAKAQADYAVARERCDDKAGNAKDVCLKEAKAAEIAAKADAKAQMKVSGANKTANEKTTAAHATADEKTVDARKDAAEDKRDADFAVAKEKCDVYSGDAKDLCMNAAKTQYGKS
jgi:hypothetical protein